MPPRAPQNGKCQQDGQACGNCGASLQQALGLNGPSSYAAGASQQQAQLQQLQQLQHAQHAQAAHQAAHLALRQRQEAMRAEMAAQQQQQQDQQPQLEPSSSLPPSSDSIAAPPAVSVPHISWLHVVHGNLKLRYTTCLARTRANE